MTSLPARQTALVVVDVQKAFDEWDAQRRGRNNPDAARRIAELLAAFRARGALVVHVRHASRREASCFRADRPGFAAKDEAREAPGEAVLVKHVNAAFIGTDLEQRLRGNGIENVVVVGATTNHCVETTARMAGNLGFQTKLVRDATWAYDMDGAGGERFPAAQVHAMTLANLNDEFAEIVTADEVLRRLEADATPLRVVIERAHAPTDEVRELVSELEGVLSANYAADQRHGLSVEKLFAPAVRFFVAHVDGKAAGCGGLELFDGYAEVKRMYSRPFARGRGVGWALLRRIEQEARAAELGVLRLETGAVQHEALRLYERYDFRRCAAFGRYADMSPRAIELSVFFEKEI